MYGEYPDRHAFRGSYGGYAFPLYDRRPDKGPTNIRPELIGALTAAYGDASKPITPEQVFDTILCLLSASTYTVRFAEDLEDVFPHVPFPKSRAVFDQAVALGAEIRAVETFARKPGAQFTKGKVRVTTSPKGKLAAIGDDLDEGGLVLCADGSGRIDNIPADVWAFSVSGYRVLRRWIQAREGMAIHEDTTFTDSLRDLVGRIGELIDRFKVADGILAATLQNALSRSQLGFADGLNEEAEVDDAGD